MKKLIAMVAVTTAMAGAAVRADILVNDDTTIKQYNSSGSLVSSFQASSGNFGMAVDANGNIYVGNDGAIDEYTSTGTSLGVFASTGIDEPGGFAFNSSGDLYVSNSNNGGPVGTLVEYSSTGAKLATIATGLYDPTGVAVDKFGNVYVNSEGTITEYSANGTSLGTFATLVDGGAGNKSGLAFDSSGDLYAATGATVEKLNSTGSELYTLGIHFDDATQGVAVDSSGDVYWVNGQDIYENSSTGSSLGVYESGLYSPGALIFTAVPEPASLSILAVGSLALLGRRRSRIR